MIVEVLVCKTDGTQHREQRDMPENWNAEAPAKEEVSLDKRISQLETKLKAQETKVLGLEKNVALSFSNKEIM